MKKLFMGFILALLIPTGVGATTFYVATNGSDSNSCSQAQSTSTPKRNIMGVAGGMSCLVAGNGDILDIRAGTYNESLNDGSQTFPSGTSYANAATIRAHSGETVTLSGSVQVALGSGTHYLIFQNLFISSSANESIWVSGDGVNPPAHHIRFINMDVTASVGNCVQVGRFSSFNEFIGGNYHNAPGYGFYVGGDDNVFDGVKVYNNAGYGFHIYANYAPPNVPDRNVVKNCEVYNNAFGILLSKGDGNKAYNNLIHDNTKDGAITGYEATNSKFYNNTIVRNNTSGTSYGGVVWGTGSGTIIKNNIVYQNTVADFADSHGAQTPTFGNNLCTSSSSACSIVGNPLFVNPAANNYAIQAGSPAMDRGATLTDIPQYDMNGALRPQGTAWDIGAYEGSAPPPPTNLVIVSSQ